MTDAKEQVLKICEILYDKKALNIRALNVADKTADMGLTVLRKEGYGEARWIVLDFGHILVHIFHPEEREFYNMERLWDDDPSKCINFSKEKGED